jgi:NNP family nitrate/nitrite transporter-like MFS transporter
MTGVVGATGAIGGFFLPPLLGLTKDWSGSYAPGFVLFGLACFLCSTIVLRAHRSWQQVPIALPESSGSPD